MAGVADEMLAPAAGPVSDVVQEPGLEPETGPAPAMDSAGVVRVWLDGGRLGAVRVSHAWRSRLGRRSLESCFAEALMIANLRAEMPVLNEDGSVQELAPPEEPEVFDGVDFKELPRFSSRAFQGIHASFEDVEQRWEQALTQREHRSDAATPTTGTHHGVSVTLDGDGHAERVSFDAKWLAGAEAEAISSHVMRAAGAAYAGFVPDDDARAELAGYRAEHHFVMAAFKAMLNREEH